MLLLLIMGCLVNAQAPWKEFTLAPVRADGSLNPTGAFQRGVLQAASISAKTLIAVATGMAPTRIVGPAWMDSEVYAITAILADDSRLRLRSRTSDGTSLDDEFRDLFKQEIVTRFHLEFHKERRERRSFTVQLGDAGKLTIRNSKSRDAGRFSRKETPGNTGYSAVDARGVTFSELCDWLETELNAPVSSSSTLPSGTWDFHLKWRTRDQTSLLAAFKEQLGLDVAEGNATFEYLVIDRMERPSL